MKALKFAAIAVGIILVLLVGLVVVLLSMFDSARVKKELTDTVFTQTQRTLKIDGELGLSFWPNLAVTIGRTSLSEHKSEQEFASIEDARVGIAVMPLLSKQIVVNGISLDGLRVTLIQRKDGTLNIADITADDKAAAKEATPAKAVPAGGKSSLPIDIASIRISNARLSWVDEKSDEVTTISGLDFSTGRIVGDAGLGDYTVNGLDLAVAGKRGADDLSLKLSLPKLMLSGDEAQTLEIGKIEGEVGITSPKLPMKSLKLPLNGALHAELAKQAASGQLSTKFDDSSIALKFDVAKFSPLDLGFDLNIDRLNVDQYLPPEKATAGKATGAAPSGPAKEERIDLGFLKGPKAHGNATIGQLQVKNLKLADIRAKIALAGGKLDVAPHSLKLYGGSLAGTLSVSAGSNAVTLRENLDGIDIGPLLKDLADQDILVGRGDVKLDVATRGETVTAMKQALGGNAAILLKDGALKGINLAQSFREFKALVTRKEDAVQQAKATDQTDFTELSASFKIKDGVARNDDLFAKSPFLRLGGTGDVDIARSRLDYLLKATVVETSGGQGGKDLEHLRGVTVPVRASGPFDQLAYKIEFGAIAGGALKAKVDEKKQEVKEDLKKRAKEELMKGLFGK